jgi:predicted nucleotidyltransferase
LSDRSSQHERGDAGAERDVGISRHARGRLGECVERVAESPFLERRRALLRERQHVDLAALRDGVGRGPCDQNRDGKQVTHRCEHPRCHEVRWSSRLWIGDRLVGATYGLPASHLPTATLNSVMDALRRALRDEPGVAYALLFGSAARGTTHAHSDVDIAIGTTGHVPFDTFELGRLTSSLETAAARPVHLVLLDDAPPGLAYRVFREGTPIVVHDRAAFRHRLARAILEDLDFKPVEDLFTNAVLRARHGR